MSKIKTQQKTTEAIESSDYDRINDFKQKKIFLEQIISKKIFTSQDELNYTQEMIKSYEKIILPIVIHLNVFDEEKLKIQSAIYLTKSITLSIKQILLTIIREFTNEQLLKRQAIELKDGQYMIIEENIDKFNWNILANKILNNSMRILEQIKNDAETLICMSLLNFRNYEPFGKNTDSTNVFFKEVSVLEKICSTHPYKEVIENKEELIEKFSNKELSNG